MTARSLYRAGTVAAVLALSAVTLAGKGTIDAASMKITVYKFAVATGKDCKDRTVVFDSATGVESDLLSNPTYGSGRVDPGTYECVIIEISSVIKTSAATSSGSCVAAQEFSDVICQDGQASELVDGTAVSCSGNVSSPGHVTLFITTASAGQSGERALLPPTSATDSTSGLKLTAPLYVAGDSSVTLRVDPTQFLDGSSTTCGTSAPSFAAD